MENSVKMNKGFLTWNWHSSLEKGEKREMSEEISSQIGMDFIKEK